MSSLIQSPVFSVAGIHLDSVGGDHRVEAWTLWTVPAGVPSRIEAVSMLVTFPAGTQHDETWTLSYLSQDNRILFTQPTPHLGTSTAYLTEQLTWARGVSNTYGDAPPVVFIPPDTNGSIVATLPLPEMVLESQGSLVLTYYADSDGGLPAIDISNIEVTYSPGGTGTAISVDVGIPLLTDVSTG